MQAPQVSFEGDQVRGVFPTQIYGKDVNVTVAATRKIHIESVITSGSGKTTHVVWDQRLKYSNTQNYLDNTTIQVRHIFETCVLLRVFEEDADAAADCQPTRNWVVPLDAQRGAHPS